ncbi:MAG: TIGR03960 family B12-binding radical SAM protein [Pirellulales bacterium]|nr:TIGR03960 family B12-binding radical SAM protein [Pirellulales bacterium]
MLNATLRDMVTRHILPRVSQPAQYVGGELNIVRKDHRTVRGKLCLAFPDMYSIGMSHHGLQVLYSLMNGKGDWACERAFTPWIDMEAELRKHNLPLYSLENFRPLVEFDVLGFTLQYEICTSNVLTMLDLGGIPLRSALRTMEHPLVIAGGPCAQNPEPLAPFIDLFVSGDGEPSLPLIGEEWMRLKGSVLRGQVSAEKGRQIREEALAQLAAKLPFAYVPRFYEPEYFPDGRIATINRIRGDVPETIEPSVIKDLDDTPLPTAPILPYVECVHDRIAIEIMRGCPWQCRFCQSTVIKRPLRTREVETIVQAALESYRRTGHHEVSLLSLSTSDYPFFEQLVRRMKEVMYPLGVSISFPSLRVNEALRVVAAMIGTERHSGMTLAPEVARDDMREQIRKKIRNEDLYEGCREAFSNGIDKVKLYFMCGLPGEREVDLDGMIDMAETIASIGKEVRGRCVQVTASVSNFVPKPHTPYQWNAMQRREYFHWAHQYLKRRVKIRSVKVKCHNVETSMLEGLLSRGDRRVAEVVELAWRRGARLDSWTENLKPELWRQALADCGLNFDDMVHRSSEIGDRLPWDHINVKKGRTYLEKEHGRSVVQLEAMAGAK